MEVLKQYPENHFDMVFADPPYHLSNGGFTVHSGRRVSVHKGKWDESRGISNDFEFHTKWIDACKRVLKPAGTIWISGTYHSIYAALQLAGYKPGTDLFRSRQARNRAGCEIRYDLEEPRKATA